ncbi:MAG: LysR family transcriptional regulator [Clostridia bacterium]|nr:LysR family transcriptional regulator [Clostridia bacterium]
MFKYADYVYKIYQEKSFTLAAKKLFISQPALSAAVKKTEEELGFKIFDRSTANLMLTDAGKVYISAIEEMNKVERNLKNYVENINLLNFGDVTVAGAAFISSFILPGIIMEYSKRHPNISVQLLEANSVNLQEKLLQEEIEILVDYDFDNEIFQSFPLKKESILLAVPKKHEINQKAKHALSHQDIISGKHLNKQVKGVDLSLFENEKFILLKAGNNMHKQSHKICASFGFAPQSLIAVDQLMTAYNASNLGMGITFTTDTLVSSAADSGNLLYYVLDVPDAERTLFIAYKKKEYVSPAVKEFVKVALEINGEK